ncbi:MAG: hypothetical protein M3N57_11105 [Actinomycetota bacterium]|nr:hypothetical protein [Actinomycetota bacterium]
MLRIPVVADGWVAALPPVPDGHDASISVSDAGLIDARSDLEALGYTLAGVNATLVPVGRRVADILVSDASATAQPDWYRDLARRAERAFPLAMGPVMAVLHELVAMHQASCGRDVTPPR